MSTEFAISRFISLHLAGEGLALFMDCDMLARADVSELFRYCEANPGKAVYCVKHNHRPDNAEKMDGQLQTAYPRKNWSSLMMFRVLHPANRALTLDLINTAPGRDLHALCWLNDDDIGELDPAWNWLVGISEPVDNPRVVHFTDGAPFMTGFENVAFADEWRAEHERWAREMVV